MGMMKQLIFLLTISHTALAQNNVNIGPELNDKNTVKVFQAYWDAFEKYENKTLTEAKQQYHQQMQNIEKRQSEDDQSISSLQIEKIDQSIRKYQIQLENHSDAYNKPFVMLNLARALLLKSRKLRSMKDSSTIDAANHALVMLTDIERNYPNFVNREEALYTKATIYEDLNQDQESLNAWTYLASIAKNTLYGAHALIAIGDRHFKDEQADIAYKKYVAALNIFETLQIEQSSHEYVKLTYRLVWASYRSARLKKVIDFGLPLLNPGIELSNRNNKSILQNDVVTVIGDALFEQDEFPWTKEVLNRNDILTFSSSIGLRVLERYHSNSLYSQAIRIGDYLAKKYPVSMEIPIILSKLASSYKQLNQSAQSITILEKLALLLPKNSLWRNRHKNQLDALGNMENISFLAAKVVSAWHYDKGMTTGSVGSFIASAGFYQTLIEYSEANDSVNLWRLRVAHCHYLSENLEEAAIAYSKLKSQYNVTSAVLQVAAYQHVLTYEKIWRKAYADAIARGDDPKEDIEANRSLKSLEQAVDEFANKFDDEGRSVDLLLVVASALRDQGYFDRAGTLWQRALVSKPNVSQRALAIRGLIFAAMKEGSSIDVITTVRKFLKMEDWSKLGQELNYELASVLSTATIEEGKRLNDTGELQKAGMILVEIAKEYPSIPDRAKILRDGAYLLALGGLWVKAEETAEMFLDGGIKEYRGDMLYLLARANEFQIRFIDAAKYYVKLGMDFPSHDKSEVSLIRGEKLSEAENNYIQAGLAAEFLARREKDRSKKLEYYKNSYEHYIHGQSFSKAEEVAIERTRFSAELSDKLHSKLMMAKAQFSSGKESIALRQYKLIADDLDNNKNRLQSADYQNLTGEANFYLGMEEKQKFDDFNIFERSGSAIDNLKTKIAYFTGVTKFFGKSEETNHPEWATRSRYYLAKSAESLSGSITGALKESGNQINRKTRMDFEARVDRLNNIAKKFYTKNVLARRQDPAIYRNNSWTKKSSIALGEVTNSSSQQIQSDVLPTALNMDLPSQWGL